MLISCTELKQVTNILFFIYLNNEKYLIFLIFTLKAEAFSAYLFSIYYSTNKEIKKFNLC